MSNRTNVVRGSQAVVSVTGNKLGTLPYLKIGKEIKPLQLQDEHDVAVGIKAEAFFHRITVGIQYKIGTTEGANQSKQT